MSEPKPRVLFLVTEDWYFSGHWLGIARALKAAGFEVAVACRVTGDGEAITGEGFHLFPIKMSRISINPFHLAACVARIVRVYGAFRPDIVHHVALKPALLGGLAARIAGIRKTINAIAGLGYVFTSSSLRARLLRPAVQPVHQPGTVPSPGVAPRSSPDLPGTGDPEDPGRFRCGEVRRQSFLAAGFLDPRPSRRESHRYPAQVPGAAPWGGRGRGESPPGPASGYNRRTAEAGPPDLREPGRRRCRPPGV